MYSNKNHRPSTKIQSNRITHTKKTLQRKQTAQTLAPGILNVIGEHHDDYVEEQKRSEDEAFYKDTAQTEVYWKEPAMSWVGNFDKKDFGDPPHLRIAHLAAKTYSRIKSNQATWTELSDNLDKIDIEKDRVKLGTISWRPPEDLSIFNVLDLAMGHLDRLKVNGAIAFGAEALIEPGNPKTENDPTTQILGVLEIVYDQSKTLGQGLHNQNKNITDNRSIFMHIAADKVGKQNPKSVWKIGQAHVTYLNSDNNLQSENYNLVNEDDANYLKTQWKNKEQQVKPINQKQPVDEKSQPKPTNQKQPVDKKQKAQCNIQ